MFKRCAMCNISWETLAEFVNDPELVLEGYQAAIPDAEKGLLLFTHTRAGCSTTLSVFAREFQFLCKGPLYSELKMESESCPGYCLEKDNFKMCNEFCRMNWVRQIIQLLKSGDTIEIPPHSLDHSK